MIKDYVTGPHNGRPAYAVSRRAFLQRGLQGAVGLGLLSGAGGLLAACGSSKSTASSATTTAATSGTTPATTAGQAASDAASGSKSLGSLAVQLQWIENFNWSGMYIAQNRGYYKDAGLEVTFLPGGPSVVPETIVLAGKAQVGLSSADAIASAILQGAPFKIIGTQYQQNPFGIMSRASDPVNTAKELVGRTVGVSDENKPELDAFLTLNGIKPSTIKTVPIGSSDVSTYLSGQITASLDFYETPLAFEAKHINMHFVSLSDLGYSIISDSYFTTESQIKSHADKLEALLLGDVRGWQVQVADPTVGATLGATVYGKSNGLDLSQEIAAAKLQNALVSTAGTKTNGLLSLSPALQAENIKSLHAAGIKITAAQLFDDSIINAVYAKNPSLKAA